MARRAYTCCGIPPAGSSYLEHAGGIVPFAPGRFPWSWSLPLAGIEDTDANLAPWTIPGTALTTVYWRCYFIIDELPVGGESTVYGFGGNIEGSGDAGILRVDTSGQILLYSRGNAASDTLVGQITTGLTVGQWYRINLQFDMDQYAKLTIDGAAYPTIGAPTNNTATGFHADLNGPAITTGLYHSTQLCNQMSPVKVKGAAGGSPQNGGRFRIADIVVDDATDPGEGAVTLVRVFADGAHQEWTGASDWRSVTKVQIPDTTTTEPSVLTNTDADNRATFQCQPFSELGITGTIVSSRLGIFGSFPRANWNAILRINGVDNETADQGASATSSWKTQSGATIEGQGHFDIASLSASDTVEIGVRDGNSTGTAARIHGICLIIDHESPDPTIATVNDDIRTEVLEYTGNGTAQRISFVDTSLTPNVLIVKPVEATGAGAMWVSDGGYRGAFSTESDSPDAGFAGIVDVTLGGFDIRGSSSSSPGVNDSGVKYKVYAIQDPFKRFVNYDVRSLNPAGNSLDDFDVFLDDAAFAPELLIINGVREAPSGTSVPVVRHADHVGDISNQLAAGSHGTNRIQSMGTGEFQLGTVITSSTYVGHLRLAFRADPAFHYNGLQMLVTGSYLGDGTGPRTINYTPLSQGEAILVVMVAEQNVQSEFRFFNDGNGTTSRDWLDSANPATNQITAWDTPGEFEVDAGLNVTTGGATYYWFILGVGTDLGPDAEIELPENGIGLTWVEVTQKDASLDVWAKVALPDPATYFGGYKEARVTRWGLISRALSDQRGQFEQADFDWIVQDVDRYVRGLLDSDTTKYFKNRPVVVRMIDDDSRRALLTPRTIIRGYISDYKPTGDLGFQFKAKDVLTARFASVGQNPYLVPNRTIELADFPHANDEIINETSQLPEFVGAVGLAVPIIYGDVNDVTTELRNVPDVPPVDTTLKQPAQHANDITGLGGNLTGGWGAYVLPFDSSGGGMAPIRGFFAGTDWDEEHAISIRWEPAPGEGVDFDHYYVFIFDGGGWTPYAGNVSGRTTRAWLFDRPVSGIYEAFPNDERPYQQILINGDTGAGRDGIGGTSSTNTGTDVIVPGSTVVEVESSKGLIRPIWVGDYDIGGTIYAGALICGHAVKELSAGYLNDRKVDLTNDPDWLTPLNTTAWAAAGFSTDYTDVNGNRYFIIYLKGDAGKILRGELSPDAGSPGVTVNIKGIESAGDGTGTLITDLLDQYKHIIINWILQQYASGAYLTAPAYDDDPTLLQVNEDSFDAAKAIAQQRLSGGYVGAFVLGAEGVPVTVRELIARLNLSSDVQSGFNRKAQFFVSMVDESAAAQAAARPLTDVRDVYSGSFDVTDNQEAHFNVVPYFYAEDYAGRESGGWFGEDEVRDSVSITNYTTGLIGGEFTAGDLELFMVRDANVAQDVAFRLLMRHKDPPRIVRLSMGLHGMNYDLGDVIKLTHYAGVGGGGYSDRPMRVVRHEGDPDQFQVHLECYDLAAIFSGAFILGDEGALASTWGSAPAADRVYGYLCNATTGLFGDGSPGKRLR